MSDEVKQEEVKEEVKTEEVKESTEAQGAAETNPAEPAKDPAETGKQENDTEPKRTPWFSHRISELTAKYREEQRLRVALESQLRTGEKPEKVPENFESLVQQRAQELARVQALNDAANKTYEAGKSKFKDFDNAVTNLGNVADLTEHPQFLEAITKLPNGADVYYHLGNHLDDAAHVLALSPVEMGLELARISARVGKPAPVSKAPPPVTTVGGTAAPSEELDDKIPIDEWIRRREKQLQSR